MQILLIDDDAALTAMLSEYLEGEGVQATVAHHGEAGLALLAGGQFDAVVLDVMLPRVSGIEVLRQIRQKYAIPVIMLTAKGSEVDRVLGLEMGADDYVPKPFSLKELEARIEAILRRTKTRGDGEEPRVLYVTENLVIDSERWEVRRDGVRVEMTSTELRLLFYLAENAGRVLSHRQLL